ncbi:hypothetical protein DSO57_1000760 [Entomophthora muscae]|uniref:Uncharacterized protein n=1 Tax=Entomophthora muscae TaxID=34485 RepID=A0ACC2T9C6_9FUNG|nr:hypothetical protein DSO57_1000760 [Entomophthora muscae]
MHPLWNSPAPKLKKQLKFGNPAIAAENLIYNMVLVNTVPNTPLSSQKFLGGLPQEVEPRDHLKPSTFSQAPANTANDWACATADALTLSPSLNIYPKNINLCENDSPSGSQLDSEAATIGLISNYRANHQPSGLGRSSIESIRRASHHDDSPFVIHPNQSDFVPRNNSFMSTTGANQRLVSLDHSPKNPNINVNDHDDSTLVKTRSQSGAPNLSGFGPAVWLNNRPYGSQEPLLGKPIEVNISTGPMGFTWTH